MSPAVPLLILLGLPLLELFTLIKVGTRIGALPTLGLTLLTAVVGVMLVRRQGFVTLMRVRESLDRGGVPAAEMLEGAALLLAGLMLALPGLITDTLGFLILIPLLRRGVLDAFLRRARLAQPPVPPQGRSSADGGSRIIEGEFRREDD